MKNNPYKKVEEKIFQKIFAFDTNEDGKKTAEDIKNNIKYKETYEFLRRLQEYEEKNSMNQERKKSNKYFIRIVLIIAVCSYFRVGGNVFDKMYASSKVAFGRVSNMKGLELHGTWAQFRESMDFIGSGGFNYEEEYLSDEFYSVGFGFYTEGAEKDRISIGGTLKLSDSVRLGFMFWYDYSERCLILSPVEIIEDTENPHVNNNYYDEETVRRYMEQYGITEEDIREYQDYVLYDIVVKSWVKEMAAYTGTKSEN